MTSGTNTAGIPLLLQTYNIQLHQMQRKTPQRLSTRIIAAFAIYWTLALVLIEVARSIARTDFPSEIREHAYLFGLIYSFFPKIIVVGIVFFNISWGAAIIQDASSHFLRRKGIESDLLSITSGGIYSYVLNRFAALCRKFLPHMVILAFAYWGWAILIGFDAQRGFGFDAAAIFNGGIVPPIRPSMRYAPIPSLLMAGILPFITLSGTLMVYSALSLLVVATTRYLQGGIMLMLRTVSFIALTIIVRPFFLPDSSLEGLLDYVIFSFADGGLRLATGAFGRTPLLNGGAADTVHSFYVWMSALVFLLMCVIISGILLELTVRRLRRR